MDATTHNYVHALLSVVWDAEKIVGGLDPETVDDDRPEWGWGYVWTLCFDEALDLLGLPAETEEATDWANTYGEWPEWGYCRDWAKDLFGDLAWFMTAGKDEAIDLFIEDIETIVADESNAAVTWFLGERS